MAIARLAIPCLLLLRNMIRLSYSSPCFLSVGHYLTDECQSPSSCCFCFVDHLPQIRQVASNDRQKLFLKKLELCCYTFDFTNPGLDVREKEMKRECLQDLVDYVNSGNGKFSDEVSPLVVHMISINLFRTLPPSKHSSMESYDLDEEEPSLEPAWPHLSIVYELLLRYVVSSDTDAKIAKAYINQQFILRLLDLFDSEDPRERDYLKTILHRIYGKFMCHRPFIRRAINHVFYRFVYETERHNGIAELLEILGSIINGFALPLKEEHKMFLRRALLPLHKPKCLPLYHQQLSYCVTQFVEKDSTLAEVVIRGLLRFWPVTNSHKEVLFLGELEEILELTQDKEFAAVAEPLFRQVSKCLTSCHFQVGERSLFLWNNEYVLQLVHHNKELIIPLIVGALEENAKQHWNPAVHSLSLNVRKMFQDMDPKLYEKCRANYEQEAKKKSEAAVRRQEQWKVIEEAAIRANG